MAAPFPLRSGANVGSGFLVADSSTVWLITCVHLITMLKETPPVLALFDGAILHGQTVPVAIPLFGNRAQRFSVVINNADGNLIDVLAIKLTPTEAAPLLAYGAFARASIIPPTVGAAATALGFPGAATGDHSIATVETEIETVHGASIVLSVPSASGMSGGPVLSGDGLVGMIHGDLGTAPNFTNALAITFDAVADQLFV